MKLRNETIAILQGFSQLNPGIVFKNNSQTLETVSLDSRVYASATIPETTSAAGVGSIDGFLNQIYLFDEAEITFEADRFKFEESAAESTPKRLYYNYTDTSIIVSPTTMPADVADNDVEFTLKSSDISKLLQAIERDKSGAYQEQADSANSSAPIPPDLPEISQGDLADLDALQRISQEYAQMLSEMEDLTPGETIESQYEIEIYGQAPNTVSIYILRDGVRQDSLLTILPTITTPNFIDDFSFFLSYEDLNIMSGLEYNMILGSDSNYAQLEANYPYELVTDNTLAFNAAQAAYASQLAIYEAEVAAGNENYPVPTPPNVDAYLTTNDFTSTIKYWIPAIYQPR